MFKLSNWVWGENEVGPGILSWFHIMWIVICIGLCVLFIKLAKKHTRKQNDIVILTIDIVLLLTEIVKIYLYDVEYYGYFRIDILPFSFCSIPLFVALIGALSKKEKIKEGCYKYLSFFGIIGGIGVLVYPVTLETYFVYISIQTMLWHTLLIVMAVYLIASRNYGKSLIKDILPSFVVFLILCVFAVLINEGIYYGFLKNANEVKYTVDQNPGAYEYYKFGYYNEDDKEFYLLAYDGEKFYLTNENDKAIDTLIIYPEIYDPNGSIPYLFVTLDEEGKYKYISTKGYSIFLTDNPYNEWGYWEIDGVFCMSTYRKGSIYLVNVNLEDNSVLMKNVAKYTGENEKFLEFIRYEALRDGDSANAFFISRHYETPIPVLKTIQRRAPYIVYLLSYILSVLLMSVIIWLITHFIKKINNNSYGIELEDNAEKSPKPKKEKKVKVPKEKKEKVKKEPKIKKEKPQKPVKPDKKKEENNNEKTGYEKYLNDKYDGFFY